MTPAALLLATLGAILIQQAAWLGLFAACLIKLSDLQEDRDDANSALRDCNRRATRAELRLQTVQQVQVVQPAQTWAWPVHWGDT